LAAICEEVGAHLIHVSTDCVFSGLKPTWMPYTLLDRPDATDPYGRSKLAGEPEGAHVTVVRTSFIGPRHGLWQWLVSREPGERVKGWRNAMWSGSTVWQVAWELVRMAADPPGGLVHLATPEPVSKLSVLEHLKAALGLDVEIVADDVPAINRGLFPSWPLMPVSDAIDARP
ncbi:hypothetical protein LCGC14_1292750, partial [marine sediment metagenome]